MNTLNLVGDGSSQINTIKTTLEFIPYNNEVVQYLNRYNVMVEISDSSGFLLDVTPELNDSTIIIDFDRLPQLSSLPDGSYGLQVVVIKSNSNTDIYPSSGSFEFEINRDSFNPSLDYVFGGNDTFIQPIHGNFDWWDQSVLDKYKHDMSGLVTDNGEKIRKDVEEHIQEAKEHANEMIEDQNTLIDNFKQQHAKEIADARSDATSAANSAAAAGNLAAGNALKDALKATSDAEIRINQNAHEASVALSAYQHDNEDRLKIDEAKISANADAIKLSVSQTEFDEAKENYKEDLAQIDIKSNKIVNSVTELSGKIDNTIIGGRNLLLNSKGPFTGKGDNTTNGNFNSDVLYDIVNAWNLADIGEKFKSEPIQFTLSFDWEAVGLDGNEPSGTFVPQMNNNPWGIFNNHIDASAKSGHFKATSTEFTHEQMKKFTLASRVMIRQDNLKANVTFTNMKLEIGNVATAWTAATEDTDAVIESVRVQFANKILEEVHNRENGDKTLKMQTEDFFSQQVEKITTGYQSEISQAADTIYASVSHVGVRYLRFNGQGNNANNGTHFKHIYVNTKSGDILKGKTATSDPAGGIFANSGGNGATDGNENSTYLSMNNHEPNQEYYMKFDLGKIHYDLNNVMIKMWTNNRTYYNVNAQVSADGVSWRTIFLGDIKCTSNPEYDEMIDMGYLGRQGIMDLTDQNFATMIKSHSGDVITGIIGDTSGLLIKGDKIIIDGNTTVTQDFYAKGGNFINLNASHIVAGTIDADKITIANFDIKNLTGDKSSFIESWWGNAYKNVHITNEGMMITHGREQTFVGNGKTQYYSSTAENIGFIGHSKDPVHNNIDYLTISVNGWHTTNPGDNHYENNTKDFYGGDGISFAVTNNKGGVDQKLIWNSYLAGSTTGYYMGWSFKDNVHFTGDVNFHEHNIVITDAYQPLKFVMMNNQGHKGTKYPVLRSYDDPGAGIVFGSVDLYLMVNGRSYSVQQMLIKLGML